MAFEKAPSSNGPSVCIECSERKDKRGFHQPNRRRPPRRGRPHRRESSRKAAFSSNKTGTRIPLFYLFRGADPFCLFSVGQSSTCLLLVCPEKAPADLLWGHNQGSGATSGFQPPASVQVREQLPPQLHPRRCGSLFPSPWPPPPVRRGGRRLARQPASQVFCVTPPHLYGNTATGFLRGACCVGPPHPAPAPSSSSGAERNVH